MTEHVPVLLHESIDGLAIKDGDTVIDCTFGGGGHSRVILEQHHVKLIAVDLDEAAKSRFDSVIGDRATFIHANFQEVARICEVAGISSVDRVLLDLGTSTFQLIDDTRGFSFASDTPLAMTLSEHGSHTGFTAYDIVNSWEEQSIADIIYAYGEDRRSRTIARAIVEARTIAPIKTSGQLATIIETAIPRYGRTHPATKTFQALRITVNDELEVLKRALDAWWERLNTTGRIAVITFHSLEDRIVKRWMKEHERVITKKPITPHTNELQVNPKSRSAKLRIIEKL